MMTMERTDQSTGSRRPLRRGTAAIVFVLALAPIVTGWVVKLYVHHRPFWVHYYDPETIYFYDGMRMAGGQPPAHADNPATPVQVVSAAIVTLTGRTPERYEAFLAVGHALIIAMVAAGMIVLLRTIAEPLPPLLQLSALWTYFLAPQAVARDGIWSPEAFYFLFGAIALAAVWRALDGGSGVRIMLAGAAVGICIATKYVFLGWLPALAFALFFGPRPLPRKFADGLLAVATGTITFLLAVTPAWSLMGESVAWLGKLALHSGSYGDGARGLPTFTGIAHAIVGALVMSKGWLVWLAIVAAGIVAAWRRGRGTMGDQQGKLAFAIAAFVSSYLLASRDPQYRYLLPSALAALLAFILAARSLPLPGWRPQIAIALVAAVLLAKNIREDVVNERRLVSAGLELHARIRAALPRVNSAGDPPVILFSWRVPEPSFALRLLTVDERNLRIVSRMYPREGHYQPWLRQVHLPDGARTWDFLVIDAADLPGFPLPHGLPVKRVDGYLIVPGAPARR